MDNHLLTPPREAYHLSRSKDDEDVEDAATEEDHNDEYTASVTSSSVYQEFGRGASSTTGTAISLEHRYGFAATSADDATAAVHEMHLALLFLLSHPEEFILPQGYAYASGMADWNNNDGNNNNANNDNESLTTTGGGGTTGSTTGGGGGHHHHSQLSPDTTPLPSLIFADDAEIVLPAAHTASQLFGIETSTGMELEAAAGLVNICKLFRRWLAILPGADHLHLIDPPGITVMRIAGHRYRVTAAHRCIWTWRNELANWPQLSCGDLVTLTIVDVFETDNCGKLLSYCPTFDNRSVQKVDRNLYVIRQHTASLKAALEKSPFLRAVAHQASILAMTLKQKVDDVVYGKTNDDDDDDDVTDERSYRKMNGVGPVVGGLAGVASFCMGEEDDVLDDGLERHEV
jgi:hypothetical protein